MKDNQVNGVTTHKEEKGRPRAMVRKEVISDITVNSLFFHDFLLDGFMPSVIVFVLFPRKCKLKKKTYITLSVSPSTS